MGIVNVKTQREYDNIKKELALDMNVVRKANNALYVGVTAILAWAITTSNSILCLLAYCVIIPVYYIVLDYNIATMKLGAYLLVFHNDKWERRLHKVNLKKIVKRHASSYRNPFIYASIASTILFFSFLDYTNISIIEIMEVIFCIVLFLWFNLYVILQKDNDSIKLVYIDAWEKIKKEEMYKIKTGGED